MSMATKKIGKPSLVDNLISYEEGTMSDKDAVKFFAELVKSGRAWTLQGHYGRTASALIDDGFVSKKGSLTEKGRHFVKYGW